jgi:hypothetical protein
VIFSDEGLVATALLNLQRRSSALANPLPVIVTCAPPSAGRVDGEKADTAVADSRKENGPPGTVSKSIPLNEKANARAAGDPTAGVVHVAVDAERICAGDCMDAPKRQAAALHGEKPLPVMTIDVLPAADPAVGENPASEGAVMYRNSTVDTEKRNPPSTDTSRGTRAGALDAGTVHTQADALIGAQAECASAPRRHRRAGAATRFSPMTVTKLPPARGPMLGSSAVTRGSALVYKKLSTLAA